MGVVRQLGPFAQLRGTPAQIDAPAPEPGQHTAQVLAEAPRRPWQPSKTTPDPRPRFVDITVLEFATLITAPLGVALLVDLGARAQGRSSRR
jgi:crotonobetainyl-CoA:carnitine CoA-transferase CaiB-like acyl-CoA transferase